MIAWQILDNWQDGVFLVLRHLTSGNLLSTNETKCKMPFNGLKQALKTIGQVIWSILYLMLISRVTRSGVRQTDFGPRWRARPRPVRGPTMPAWSPGRGTGTFLIKLNMNIVKSWPNFKLF